MKLYDQQHIQAFYDEYAELETQRWDKSMVEKVKLAVHLHYLDLYIQKGDAILELGAGTGIFTKALAKYTSDLTVTDLSPVQLELNKRNAVANNYNKKVKAWHLTDICDLSEWEDNTFDKIVCYGGPLSYVFEQKIVALKEMRRVLRPGGVLLFSVMNLWGTVREYLTKIMLAVSKEDNDKIIQTGDLHPSSFAPSAHHCHMFTITELKADIEATDFETLALSASNCLSALRANDLEEIKKDPEEWAYFLKLEINACQSPGMLEAGTHIIAVVKKASPQASEV